MDRGWTAQKLFHLSPGVNFLSGSDGPSTVTVPQTLAREALRGRWDGTSMLLDRCEAVEELARRLPYVAGF